MIATSNNFDPISLLTSLDKEQLSEKNIEELRKTLTVKVWDYLTIKLSQDLTEDQLEEVLNAVSLDQRSSVLKKHILNFDEKVDKYLNEFKQDFKEES